METGSLNLMATMLLSIFWWLQFNILRLTILNNLKVWLQPKVSSHYVEQINNHFIEIHPKYGLIKLEEKVIFLKE